jgi:hypothetical protein
LKNILRIIALFISEIGGVALQLTSLSYWESRSEASVDEDPGRLAEQSDPEARFHVL